MRMFTRLFLAPPSPKEIRRLKKVMAGVMLPLLVFYSTSLNVVVAMAVSEEAELAPVVEVKEEVAPKEEAPKAVEVKAPEEKSLPQEEAVTEPVAPAVEPVVPEAVVPDPIVAETVPAEPETPVLIDPVVPAETEPAAEEPVAVGPAAIAPEVVPVESIVPEIVPVVPDEAQAEVETWKENSDGSFTTNAPVVLDVAYVYPENDKVEIRFTKLPETPGKITIQEIDLSAEQMASLRAVTNKAYDVTSDMVDGTFAYDLTLPKPADQKNVQIRFAEDLEGLKKADAVAEDDVKTETDSVVADLDHFTIFVVTTYADIALTTSATAYKQGETVYAKAYIANDSHYYNLDILDPTSAVVGTSSGCQTAVTSLTANYALPSDATVSNSWSAVAKEYANQANCIAGAGSVNTTTVAFKVAASATAHPELRAAGPVSSVNGFPLWYADSAGKRLQLCLGTNPDGSGPADLKCVLPSTNPIDTVASGNFPDEAFYYIADSNPLDGGAGGAAKFKFRMALEGAFASGTPQVGQQIAFLRINLQQLSGLTPSSEYTVTYPFGSFVFHTNAAGESIGEGNAGGNGAAFRNEDGSGAAGDFTSFLPSPLTKIGQFLKAAGAPAGYIGDGVTLGTIDAGPIGNFLRIDGPNVGGLGVNSIETNLWTVAGKIATPVLNSIQIAPVAPSVPVGTTQQFTAVAFDQFGDPIAAPITWTSSNTTAGDIDPNSGLFTASPTAVLGSTTDITATSGPVSQTTTVTITSAPSVLTSITIVPDNFSLAYGQTRQFTALQYDQFSNQMPVAEAVSWSSSDPAVATIDAVSGMLTAMASGSATITATSGAVNGTTTVTVHAPLPNPLHVSQNADGSTKVDPAHGFPLWYSDSAGTRIQPCLAGADGLADPNCVLFGDAGYILLDPIVFPTNFPGEFFYYIADANAAGIKFRMALEGSFTTGTPVAGNQITFLRINLQQIADLRANSIYTVTYPFGTFTFTTDAAGIASSVGGQAFRAEDGPGAGGNFTLLLPATKTNISKFLAATSGVTPAGYLGNNGLQTIEAGTNPGVFTVAGPDINGTGETSVSTDQWTVTGKLLDNTTPAITPIADQTVFQNTLLNFTATATDAQGDAITYSVAPTTAIGNEAAAVINPTTGVFSWTPTTLGTSSFTISAFDGSATATATVNVNVIPGDTTAPDAPVIATPAQAVNTPTIHITGTAEADATITITGGSAVATGTATGGNFDVIVTLNQNIVNNLSVTATDAANNVSAPAAVAITHDNIAPTGTLSINSGATYTTSTGVTLTISATDLSGVSQMNVYNGSAFNAANWEAFATTKAWTIPASAGPHTVNIRFRDNVGNENSTLAAQDDIILDTTAPTATVAYDITTPTNGNVIATATVSEAVTFTSAGAVNTHTFAVNGTFLFEFVDAAGNTGSVLATVANIDKVAPVITIIGANPINVAQGSVYTDAGATASDNNDGDITVNISAASNVNTAILGAYAVTYDVSDAAGNPAVQAVRVVNVIDTAVTLTSIAITTPAAKLAYQVGDVLNLAGLVVTGTYSDASTRIETVTGADVSGFDSSAVAASQVLTVTVGGQTATFAISIAKADSITTVTCPVSEVYTGVAIEPCAVLVTGANGLNFSTSAIYLNNLNVGTASASYTFAGDATHNSSADSQNFDITQKTLTVTPDDQSKIYGELDPLLTVTYVGFVPGETVAVLDVEPTCFVSLLIHENIGSYPIVCSDGADNNYTFEYFDGELTVTAKTINVTADAGQTKIYGEADPALTYTNDPLVGADTFGGALSRVAGENVGPYAIGQGTLALSSNYTLNFTGDTFDITAKTIDVTADAQTKIFGATDPTLTYTSDPLVIGDAFAGGLARVAGENVGTYAINQGTLALSANYTLNFTGDNLEITQAPSVTTVTCPASVVYDGTPQTPCTATVTGAGGLNQAEVVTYSADNINVGTVIASATFAGDVNHSGSSDSKTFEITAKIIPTVAVTNSPVSYNAGPQAATVVGSVAGVVSNVLYDGFAVVPTNAGTYAITADFAPTDSAAYESLAGASAGNFTIDKVALSVTANDNSKTYGTTKTYGVEIFQAGLVGLGDSITGITLVSSGDIATASVGTYPITPSDATGTGLANYDITYHDGTLTVSKADPVIVVTPYSVPFDGTAHTATGTATGVFAESLSGLDLSGTTHTDAGTYATDPWTFTDVTGNYNDANGTVADSIGKLDAVINVNGFTGTYDGAAHGATGSATGVGSIDLSASLNLGSSFTNVPGGVANWIFTGGTNYNDASGSVAIDIDAKTITVTADVQSKVLGDADPVLTYAFAPALIGADTFSGALTRDPGEAAGIYAITQGTLTAGGNYALNYAGADLTIFEFPPVITGETATTPTETSVIITWTTDHPASSRVIYDTVPRSVLGVAPNYGYAHSTSTTDNAPKVTSHTVVLSGLTAGTTYYYRAVSQGSPEAVSSERSFVTASAAIADNGDDDDDDDDDNDSSRKRRKASTNLASSFFGTNAAGQSFVPADELGDGSGADTGNVTDEAGKVAGEEESNDMPDSSGRSFWPYAIALVFIALGVWWWRRKQD